MPALPPPSMQIGALPPGFGPLPPNGPQRQLGQTPALPVLVQSAGAVTSSSGPTNISQTVTSTKVGTLLVWAVAVNASAAAALGGTPAGWTLATSQTVATLALGIYVYPNNPGAITAVTFSSNATATTGGIAAWFYEVDNAPFSFTQSVSANGSSTAPASGSLTPKTDSSLILGAFAWVLGTATLAQASTGGYAYTTNAQQSSTAGTTNAAIETQSNTVPFGAPAAAQIAGTLSVSSVWAAALLIIPSSGGSSPLFFSPGRSNVIDGGAGYGVGETGVGGWALGNTKPGGAGGGQ